MAKNIVHDTTLDLIRQIKTISFDKYEKIKETDPALYYAYKAVEVEPWTMPYREHLVNLLIKRKSYKDALEFINDGLSGQGAWWKGYELKGLILKEYGDLAGSLENFSIAMNNEPTLERGCLYIEICIDSGKTDIANNIIDNILNDSPEMAIMYYYKALIAKKQNNIPEALELINKATEYDDKNIKFKSLLVEIMLLCNEYQQALKYVMENLNRHRDWGDAYYFMALILRQYGKVNEAIECAKKAIEIDKDDARYVALLMGMSEAAGNNA